MKRRAVNIYLLLLNNFYKINYKAIIRALNKIKLYFYCRRLKKDMNSK